MDKTTTAFNAKGWMGMALALSVLGLAACSPAEEVEPTPAPVETGSSAPVVRR